MLKKLEELTNSVIQTHFSRNQIALRFALNGVEEYFENLNELNLQDKADSLVHIYGKTRSEWLSWMTKFRPDAYSMRLHLEGSDRLEVTFSENREYFWDVFKALIRGVHRSPPLMSVACSEDFLLNLYVARADWIRNTQCLDYGMESFNQICSQLFGGADYRPLFSKWNPKTPVAVRAVLLRSSIVIKGFSWDN